MTSLAAKYDYLEKLTRKVCVSRNHEPKNTPYGKVLNCSFHINSLVNTEQTPATVMSFLLLVYLFIQSLYFQSH